MLNHLQQHHSEPLSIEQLLQAARLIEQRAIEKMLVGGINNNNNGHIDGGDQYAKRMDNNNGTNEFGGIGAGLGRAIIPSSAATMFPITKLGEDYEERMLASKMRANFLNAYAAPNSTGSSRRSSPISIASSAPSSPGASQGFMLCAAAASNALANIGGAQRQQQQQNGTTAAATTMQMMGATTTFASTSDNNGTNNSNAAASSGTTPSAAANVRAASSASSNASSSSRNGRRVSGSRQSRAAHNELEKNRRANLRGHLEALKSVLLPETDTHRDTTLSLLTRARNCIRLIKEQKCVLADKRAELLAEHLRLREQLIHGSTTAATVCANNNNNTMVASAMDMMVDVPSMPNTLCTPPTAPIVVLEQNNNTKQEVVEQQQQLITIIKANNEEQQQTTSGSLPIEAGINNNNMGIGINNGQQQQSLLMSLAAMPLAAAGNENDGTTSTSQPNMDFLLMNGLLPALPLLYPYSAAAAMLATVNL